MCWRREDTDALNTFPDKGEVSSWAANAVAALVENGYVTGSNGKLNPKSQITRAEFAQVISNLAGTYVDQSGPAAPDGGGQCDCPGGRRLPGPT